MGITRRSTSDASVQCSLGEDATVPSDHEDALSDDSDQDEATDPPMKSQCLSGIQNTAKSCC